MKHKYSVFEQVQCERDISDANFTKGQQNFMFETEGIKSWNPYRSYFRARVQLTKGDETQLDSRQLIALNMFAMDNCYQQMCVKCCGKELSSIQDYVPQIGNLTRRMKNSHQMLKSMKQLVLSEPDIEQRINDMSAQGNDYSNPWQEKIRPGDVGTVALTGPTTAPLVASTITVLGLRADKTAAAGDLQQNHGRFTFTANALGGGNQIQLGDTIRITEPGGAYSVDATYVQAVDAQNGFFTFQVGDNAEFGGGTNWVVVNSETTRRTVVGVGTTFTNDFVAGDVIEIEDVKYQVGDVPGDLALSILELPLATVAATANWSRIRTKETRRATNIELIWKPPMGIFDVDDYICGKWKIELTPVVASSLENYVVETVNNIQPGDTAITYKFKVVDLMFYAYTGYDYGKKASNKSMPLSFIDCRAQSQNLTTTSLTDKTFVVNPSCEALTLFYQSENASSGDTSVSRSKLKIENDEELNLTRFYIKYGGYIRPSPIPDPSLTGTTDYISQNFYEQLMYSGQKLLNSDIEPLETWKKRGMFFHYRFPKRKEKTERAYVSSQFSALTGRPQVFIVDHFRRNHKINIVDGYVKGVTVDEPVN
jgi:hypothetical protein